MRRPSRRPWVPPAAALALLATAGAAVTAAFGFAYFAWLRPAHQHDALMSELWDIQQESYRVVDDAIAEVDAGLARDIREQQERDEQWARSWAETIKAMRLDPSETPPSPPYAPRR